MARSHKWIEDIVSHLSKSENEDLVRQTLEAHNASQPSRAEEEKQAYGWIQWAKHRQHLKVVTCDVPSGILPKGVRGLLHDGKVFTRRGPDDSVYDKNLDIRQKVARGNCFLEILDGKDAGVTCLVYALKKFTGGLGDDDDRESGDKQVWKKYFTKPIEEAKLVVATRKANGEAAHLSARRLLGERYICAGSKNVHVLVKTRDDIDKYTDSRFNYAKEICYAVLDLTDSLDKDVRERLLDFLCETKLTAVMEMLSPRHQHVEDFSDLEKTELRFITWTSSNLESQTDNLCCMPPHVGIDIAQSLGIPTVDYEMVTMDALDERMKTIRQGYSYEGEVLYFLDSESVVIGLLKKKTIWYIVCRAIREKLRAACHAHEKNSSTFSLSSYLKKVEKRCDEIQLWLSLDQETTNEWKTLGVKCMRWTVEKLKAGELNTSDIADFFPVTWKKYLTETEQSDHIKARDYDDAAGSSPFSSH